MKIPLKPDSNLVKKRPYILKLKYKDKVKVELDKMITVVVIEPLEELEWASPMVVQENKTQG